MKEKKHLLIITVFILIITIFVGCGQSSSKKIFIGLKVLGITTTNDNKLYTIYNLKALYFDGTQLSEQTVMTATVINNNLVPQSFSYTNKKIYVYLPPDSKYHINDSDIIYASTLPYFPSPSIGSGIAPIYGGYIVAYDYNGGEIYLGNKKIMEIHIPWNADENPPFILTGFKKQDKLYLIWGYSSMRGNTPQTVVQLYNITDNQVMKTATVSCFVSCSSTYLSPSHYLLCQDEKKKIFVVPDISHTSFSIQTLNNNQPDPTIQIGTYHITIKDNSLQIDGKQVDSIKNNGFYILYH